MWNCRLCLSRKHGRTETQKVFASGLGVGERPIVVVAAECYPAVMNLLLLIIVLLLLFGGGGFYIGGPAIGGGGLGLVLLISLIVYLMGGFNSKA